MTDWRPTATQIIEHWEQCRLHAYPDPATGAEPYTVGWGATGPNIGPDTVWTQEQADADLARRIDTINRAVTRAVRVRLSPEQRAALVSLAYNIGTRAFANSTLVRLLNAGDYAGVADQFLRWNRANGRVMRGLTNRRAAERELFLQGMGND